MSDKCNEEIYKKGSVVAMLSGCTSVIESIVVQASKDSGIEMDWHYFAVRGIIKTLGDVKLAASAINSCMPQNLE